ncbi:MAG: hypothetical protein J6Y78_04690 [Paludibacteraceae bacterium]|nr:hypothetical protein [Paludibacteraceae bacterium]
MAFFWEVCRILENSSTINGKFWESCAGGLQILECRFIILMVDGWDARILEAFFKETASNFPENLLHWDLRCLENP